MSPAAGRRSLLLTAVAAAVGHPAAAQPAWPSRPVRVIVPYAPGGTSDVSIRALAPQIGERIGQPLVMENRTGANGAIGMEAAARSAPDGYTLAVAADSAVFQTLLRPNLPYDVARDFEPVSLLVAQPIVIAVHPSLGVASLAELVALARRTGEEMPYVVAGLGGTQHLAAALFADRVGIRLTPVAYRGGGNAVNDLVGGQVPLGIIGSTPVLPHARDGRLRLLAVTSRQRSPAIPDVPTVAEAVGLDDFGLEQWFGLFVPRRTPAAVIERLNAAVAAALEQDETRRLFAELALDRLGGTPQDFAARIARESRVWTEAGARLGLGG